MTVARTYLDHNATSPLRPEARAAMLAAMDMGGNPSSVHAEGRQARAIVETAREQVAALVDAKPSEVVFTSGATEANNRAIACGGWSTILASGIEHDSIRTPVSASGARKIELPATTDGEIAIDRISRCLSGRPADQGPVLLTLQLANNETGVIQPVAAAFDLARKHGVATHTDAVQAAGKIVIDFRALGADSMSLSAHKLGGPAGVGALVVRDGFALASAIVGGGQERRQRAGTENLVGIAGFGAAAAAARIGLADSDRIADLRTRLTDGIRELTPEARMIGTAAQRLPNTIAVSLPDSAAETMVIKLDLAGVAVSAGAACSSGKVGASHVLAAMGLPAAITTTTIRISLGWNSTAADVDAFLTAWAHCARRPAIRAVA